MAFRAMRLVKAAREGDLDEVERILRQEKVNCQMALSPQIKSLAFKEALGKEHGSVVLALLRVDACATIENVLEVIYEALTHVDLMDEDSIITLLDEHPEIAGSDIRILLHMATELDYRRVVRAFLEKGANVNYENGDGQTALHLAVDNGLLELANILIAAGADVSLRSHDGLSLTQAMLCTAILNDDHRMVQALLAASANPNDSTDEEGETALRLAVMNSNLGIVK